MAIGPPASLAEQLKQVLAERERRLAAVGPTGASQPDPVQLTHDLVDEIRQAVNEANARGSFFMQACIFICLICVLCI